MIERPLQVGAILLLLATAAPGRAELADRLHVEATLTSRYLHRGINYSGGSPAIQGLVEYSTNIGIYGGIWASSVEVPWDDRQAELDYFAGYQHRFNGIFALDATLIRYTYQGPDVDAMYNWREGQLTAHIFDHWTMTVARADNWAGRGRNTTTIEGTWRHALRPRWIVDATLGHAEVENALGFNYQWGEVGLARGFGPAYLRLAYAATNGADALGDLSRNRWLISVGWRR